MVIIHNIVLPIILYAIKIIEKDKIAKKLVRRKFSFKSWPNCISHLKISSAYSKCSLMYTILYLFENMIIIFGTSYMACALEQNNMSLPEYIRITKNI
jgi:hypothetical protein